MWTWNDLIDPIIYLRDIQTFTLTAGLSLFQGQYVGRWPLLMAGALVSVIPMIVLFVVAQRQFVRGHRHDRDQGMSRGAASRACPLYRRIEADLRDRIRTGELRAGRPGRDRARADGALRGQPGDRPPGARRAHRGGRARDPARARDVRRQRPVRAHDRRVLLVQPRDRAARPAAGDAGPRAAHGAGRRRRGRGARRSRRDARSSPCAGSGWPDDEPLVVETSHLPAARFPGLETVDFSRSGCTTR